MIDDVVLLQRYAAEGDEMAFRELVERHVALVYATALRQLNGDGHLAEDIAQMVFAELASSAGKLPEEVVLAGWLYRAAHYASAKAVRTEHRRRAREAAAALEQDNEVLSAQLQDDGADWEALSAHLDAAIIELEEKDRSAILLRFFQGSDFKAIGMALQVSDDTAQKRVTRALEKLRHILAKRGLPVSVVALGTLITTNAMAMPPAGLAIAIASGVKGSLASGAAVASGGLVARLLSSFARHKWAYGGSVIVAGLIFVASLFSSSPQPAVTFDLSRDYASVGSPTTPWSFGWATTLTGTLTPLGHLKKFLSDNGEPINSWQVGEFARPAIARNMGNRTAVSAGGVFVAPPGAIWYGPETNDSIHNFAVIRLTVPPGPSRSYRITTAVYSAFDRPNAGEAYFYILKNGQELFRRLVGPNSGTAHSGIAKLAPGDRIEFVTGRGRNPNDEYAVLRIRATVTTDLAAPTKEEIASYGFAVAPVIVSPPVSQSEDRGSATAFEVAAAGTPPLAYQWWFGGSPLHDATGTVLRVPDIEPPHLGEYFVVVSNVVGAMTSSIARLTLASCAPVPPGLVGWWPAEQTAVDRFAGQPGRMMDGTTFAPGRVGRAFLFVGPQAGVRVPASPALDIGDGGKFTVELWIKPETVSGKMPLVGWNSSRAYGVNLSVVSGRLYANLRDSEQNSHTALSAAGAVASGKWQHVALTFDSQAHSIRLFCHGRMVADETTEPFSPNTKFDLQFGRRLEREGILTYTGLMDEICIYNRALAPEEIAAIAAAGAAGKCVTRATAQAPPTPRQP